MKANDRPIANFASLIYRQREEPDIDPAESYHEASKFYPSMIFRQSLGGFILEKSPELQMTAARSTKRFPNALSVALPPPELPQKSFKELIEKRTSRAVFRDEAITLAHLGTLLFTCYGITRKVAESPQCFRTVPSGGGLYPLDIYCLPLHVSDVEKGVYHYDPFRHSLELVQESDLQSVLARGIIHTNLLVNAAAIFFITGMFARGRFKYGLRSYRFTMLEAGHVMQNLLLGAEALGLQGQPVGGYYDTIIDQALGLDGVNESTIYLGIVGHPFSDRETSP